MSVVPNAWHALIDSVARMGDHADVFKAGHGSVAVIDREGQVVYTKPSGMGYSREKYYTFDVPPSSSLATEEQTNAACEKWMTPTVMRAELISGVDLKTGEKFGKPSVDVDEYVLIFSKFDVDAVCHSHSTYATAYAINRAPIRCCCTEHADWFGSDILVANPPLLDWGKTVFAENVQTGAVLLGSHGVLTFGKTADEAVDRAVALEEVANKTFVASTLCGMRQLAGGPTDIQLPLGTTNVFHERFHARRK